MSRISVWDRLDGLSSFRIHPSAVRFNSEASGGNGGKSNVVKGTFRPRTEGDEQPVAVKKIQHHNGTDERKWYNGYIHEVEVMAKLSHENIIRLIGFVEDLESGKAWIVLSWESNGSLSEFLATGDWEIPERFSLIRDTFEGIKYLHTLEPPICHSNLKTLNILVNSSYRAVITDFGSAVTITQSVGMTEDRERDRKGKGKSLVARGNSQIRVTASGKKLTLTGPTWSLRWAPPEVVSGRSPELASDIWAAGWICWEVITNKLPFPQIDSVRLSTFTVVEADVPSTREDTQLRHIINLCGLMTECWSFDPRARPGIAQGCSEMESMPSTRPSRRSPSGSSAPSIQQLLAMSEEHLSQNIPLLQQAMSLAMSAGDQKAMALALTGLGESYSYLCRYAQAENSYIRAWETYVRISDELGQADTLDGLGEVYRRQSKYTQAEESFNQALEIYVRIDNGRGQAKTLFDLGELYRFQLNDIRAEQSYVQSREIYARIGDDLGQANTLWAMANVYICHSKYTQAEQSYTQAGEIYGRINSDLGKVNTLLGLGQVYRAQSKFIEAEETCNRALEIYSRINSELGQAEALSGLGEVYHDQSKYAEAAEYLTRALEIYARVGAALGQGYTMFSLGKVYWMQLRNAEAATYFAEAKDLFAQIGDHTKEKDAAEWLAKVLG